MVALESTIIAHGMPFPVNLETALAVERIIEEQGAVPATVGILGGCLIAGLSSAQIECIATGKGVLKACERDLPLAVAGKLNAATTAGASIAIAAAAGIRVFVTGGIGGVGPSAARDFDISADLPAIAHYPVIAVCAGTKAFMDVAATLEYLETLRVPVATWRSEEFPLFYCARSGCKSGWVVQSANEIAGVFAARLDLGMSGGLLVGVPLPEEHSLPEAEVRPAMDLALQKASQQGITGKALTPFLLAAIHEATAGRSLGANIALIKNNARVGAEIAVAVGLHTQKKRTV